MTSLATHKPLRRSGILLHITSLPGPHGSGDMGSAAHHFVDWLKAGQQSLWQVLPLGDIGAGNSPYMSPSAFGGNIFLIDLNQLAEANLLTLDEITPPYHFSTHRIDYPAVERFRLSRLRMASDRFFSRVKKRDRFEAFCQKESAWLDDYALFQTLDSLHASKGWQKWPSGLVNRDPQSLRHAATSHATEIRFWQFCQWCFEEQWNKLHRYANDNGVSIIGDVPIFVSLNSADVWSRRALFELDTKNRPLFVAGAPPDQFSETGQLWGNPLYNWRKMAKDHYRWWIERIGHALRLCDFVRIDHFRGFESYWKIPAAAKTAIDGRWDQGPGANLFLALENALGSLNLIAEDLGILTDEVIALRKRFRLPGMRVLQFAFNRDPRNPHLPYHHESDSVVYPGTHDNNTTRGWWNALAEYERDYVRRYLSVSGDWIHWDMIRAAFASVARTAIVPMQDVLGLDEAHRMNLPGTATGSWEWRFSWDQVENWHAPLLSEMTQLYGRVCEPEETTAQERLI
jgi:4-alpha-glucanotransferase